MVFFWLKIRRYAFCGYRSVAPGEQRGAFSLTRQLGLCAVGLVFVVAQSSIAGSAPPTATIEILHSHDRYVPGSTAPVAFKINIEDGWGIHGPNETEQGLIPTRLEFDSSSELNVTSLVFPKPTKVKYEYTSEAIEVFTREVLVRAWLQIENAQPSVDAVLKYRFSYQACSAKSCRPPETISGKFPIPIAKKGESVNRLNRQLFTSAGTRAEATQDFIETDTLQPSTSRVSVKKYESIPH